MLASQGTAAILTARRLDRLESLAETICARGGKALAVQMEATDSASMVAAVAAGEAAIGTVNIPINNTGILDAQRARKMSLELVDQVLGVNLRGPWILACEVARRLIAACKPGQIVSISSVTHYRYDGGGAALYAVAKTAIARMTEAFSVEWEHYGINVNAIVPGMFVSEMTDGMFARMGGAPRTFRASACPCPPRWIRPCSIWLPRAANA